jgi:hypothetical protein
VVESQNVVGELECWSSKHVASGDRLTILAVKKNSPLKSEAEVLTMWDRKQRSESKGEEA